MKKIGKSHIIIVLIFLLALSLRLYLAFSSQYFSDDSSYFILRQIEYISENKIPLFSDTLSYSGRNFVFSPIYHYFLSVFSLFFSTDFISTVIPNLLASLIVFPIFFITLNLTKNKIISLFTAFTSIFIPIFLKDTYNSLTSISLIILLTYIILYSFLRMRKKSNLYLLITLIVILSILTPLSILLILGLIIYLLLCKLAGIKNYPEEKEIIIFSVFFSLWSQFLLYKNAFLKHSYKVIWGNIPIKLLNQHFLDFSVAEAIYQIGFVVFLCSLFVIYKNLFSEKDRKVYLFFGLAISTLILLWFRLIAYSVGLTYLGFIFVILFGYFLNSFFTFLKKIHMSESINLFSFIIILLVIFGSMIPSGIEIYNSFDSFHYPDDVEAFKWIEQNIDKNAIIMVPVKQAHSFTYFAKRKNVMDTNFILINNVDQRLADLDEVYTTSFMNNAIRNLNKYGVDYLVFTKKAQEIYNLSSLTYVEENCFRQVYNESSIKIYHSLCTIEEK